MTRLPSDLPHIRPRIELDHAIVLRDLMQKIVVNGLMSGELSNEERNTITLFELKLTELIILSQTREAIRALKSTD